MAMLDEEHDLLPKPPNDKNVYTLGSISGHNVIIACLPEGQIGTNSAANVATQMMATFPSVRFGLMVGIGGGIPSRVRLGDVVVSRPSEGHPGVVQWDFGKAEQEGQIRLTGSLNQPPTALLTALTKLKSRHEMKGHNIHKFLDQMTAKWPRLAPKYTWSARLKDPLYSSPKATADFSAVEESRKPGEISIHYGLIASGNQVIKDSATRDRINKSLAGQVLCFEMEAAGLMNDFPCIVIRGICDYADSHKKKDWQEYAAAIAAAFAKELLEAVQTTDVEGDSRASDVLKQVQDASSTRDDIMHMMSRLDETADKEVLDWLTTVDYSLQHSNYVKKRQPGTGKWLLDTQEFKDLKSGNKKTLVCRGIPGAGKTILTSVAIHHLQNNFRHDQNVGIAYIYCHYKQQGDQDIDNLLASLLKQLLRSRACLPESTAKLFKRHKEKQTRPSHDELLANLKSVIQLYKMAFFVIDAMDECQFSTLKQLLFHLFDLQEDHDIRIFATSRPIPEIMSEFTSDNHQSILDVWANPSDVLVFLEGQIPSLPHIARQNPQLQEEIKRGISEAVDGMFLLAEIYITLLRDKTTINSIREALDAFREKNKSNDSQRDQALDHAYEQAMERIDNQKPGLKALAMGALSWIALAKRNLTVEELQHALATKEGSSNFDKNDLPDLADISNVCAGLVTVDVESNVIRLVHSTTQEYFERTQSRWFPDAESMMSKICITYISFDVFGENFRPTDWFDYHGERYPFYNYAVNNWTQSTPEDMEPNSKLMSFILNRNKVNLAIEKLHTNSQILTHQFGTSLPKSITALHFAVYFGATKVVSNLLELEHKIGSKDNCGRTPLWWAAQGGQGTIVKLLLDAGASLEDSDSKNGHTPLMCAVQGEHQTIVSLLLEKGSKVDSRDKEGLTPLIMASKLGAENIVTLLLKKGKADINLRDSSEKGWTPLHWAIDNHDDALARLLLKEGADIEAKNSKGQTLLLWAVENGYDSAVRMLLGAGANMSTKNKRQTASRVIASRDAKTMLQSILNLNPHTHVRRQSGSVALLTAVQFKREEILRLLQDAGANMNHKDDRGWTLLFHAVHRDNEGTIINMLLDGKIDVNAKDKSGKTALFIAIDRRDESKIYPPLYREADSSTTDTESRLPFIYSSQHSNMVAIELLLEKGADINATDECERTPLLYAIIYSMSNVIKLLIDRGADVNARDRNGWTPLLAAVHFGRDKAVKLLLDTGNINIDAKDVNHETARSLAVKKRRNSIIQLLDQSANTNSRKRPDGIVERVQERVSSLFKTELPLRRAKN
ncbi:hypothetical protein A0O28_0003070 [Trichoderma guizhouense]|uniref:Uncharacterized protein n=1 Tax=Trichoderma guizhouense TaxID=1491466 RepID=A0A1T3CGK4_9HYPO|nr:hypothetical protein A0O28_0003070 [Trichoderma guizhouense]